MKPPERTLAVRVIFALTLVHFMGDFYSSFISPLFPLYVARLDLSLTQVGLIAGVSRFLAFIVQPSVGYLADRYQSRLFALGGLLLAVVFIPLSGIAPSFLILLACIAVGSIGSSMFHPAVTGMVPLYAGRHAGFAMSLFNTGGTTAFAVGPLFITWFAATFGLEKVPFTMLIGLAAAVYLFFTVPRPVSEELGQYGFIGSLRATLGHAWRPLTLIWLVMVLRAIVGQAFATFMPVLFVQRGYSLVAAGAIFALFTLAGTLSGLLAGGLSDRVGFRPIFVAAHALMAPVLILMLYLPGAWVYAGAFCGGFFTLATLPLGVVMAQTLAPRGRSMVASLMMGFAYGLGGAFSPLIGKLADLFSIHQVLVGVTLLAPLTLVLIARFPDVSRILPPDGAGS